ncbi:MAG: hypothetical protein NC338_00975 [Firmicutes bacterium]|nr:hypothetical protein [Bacillota bacterium]MCM1400400.1 hypothetical protein [Bacteroides sp.]MCM1477157.1 hypothetical protein [Bacteroides sp.]
MKRLLKLTGLWMSLALIVSSCSSNTEKLLKSVPFDAEVVATANLVELASKSGVTIEDGRLVLPREYSYIKDNIPAEALKTAGQIAGAIDLENVVLFGYINRNQAYLTAMVKDVELMRSLLKSNGWNSEMNNGLEVWSQSTSDYADCLALSSDETQVWFLDSRKDLTNIDEFEHSRKKNNILRYSGLADALTRGNVANLVVDMNAVKVGLDDYWAAVSFTVNNNAVVLTSKAITTDGNVLETTELQTIDTDFLRYMPSNFICAMAMGVAPGGGFAARMEKSLDESGNNVNRGAFSQIMPFIKALDGTVAFGFGPKSKSSLMKPESPEQWQALFMAHMSQAKANELTEMARSFFPTSTSSSNGIYTFTSRDFTINYGVVDGNFAVGMGLDLVPNKSNSFTNDFNGKPFAAVFQTPLLSSMVSDTKFDFSIKAAMEVNNSEMRLQINLVGTDAPIIPTLVSTMPDFFQRYEKAVRSSY